MTHIIPVTVFCFSLLLVLALRPKYLEYCTMVEEPPASRRRDLTARYSKYLLLALFICISSIIPSISKYTVTNNNVVLDNESNSQIAKEVSFENDGVEDGQTTTDTPLKPWLKDAAVRQSIRLNQTNYAIRGPSWLNNITSGTPTNNELEKNISVAVHDANQTSIPTTEDNDVLNMTHSIQHNGTIHENHTVMNQVSNNATTDHFYFKMLQVTFFVLFNLDSNLYHLFWG